MLQLQHQIFAFLFFHFQLYQPRGELRVRVVVPAADIYPWVRLWNIGGLPITGVDWRPLSPSSAGPVAVRHHSFPNCTVCLPQLKDFLLDAEEILAYASKAYELVVWKFLVALQHFLDHRQNIQVGA